MHSRFWLMLRIRQWWIPFLLTPIALHRDLSWHVAHGYDRTSKVLPGIDDRPIPDADTSCCKRSRS
jgi:hypothetical protein